MAALESQASPTKKSSGTKPLILSTWSHGLPANADAWAKLKQTGSILDAVEAGVRNTELDLENLSVGLQGLPDREGITTLDENGKQTPTTGLLVNVLSSLSEFFYHQNREKTLMGIELAKKQGKYKGRVPNSREDVTTYMNKPKTKKMLEMLKQGSSIRSIVRVLEVSPNSVYKLKKLSQNVLN
jgi:DNA invertase Pin-like site-specific DNA recombinase